MAKALTHQTLFLAEPQVDPVQGGAVPDDVAVGLTQVELRLLSVLASQPGRIFSRSELLRSLYTDHRVVSERTVDVHVKNLRRKLRVAHPKRFVRTWYGFGYLLDVTCDM